MRASMRAAVIAFALALTVTFGAGTATKIDSVEIAWPSGKKQTLTDVAINKLSKIHETQGLVARR